MAALWQSLADESGADKREQPHSRQIKGAQTACFRIHLNYWCAKSFLHVFKCVTSNVGFCVCQCVSTQIMACCTLCMIPCDIRNAWIFFYFVLDIFVKLRLGKTALHYSHRVMKKIMWGMSREMRKEKRRAVYYYYYY